MLLFFCVFLGVFLVLFFWWGMVFVCVIFCLVFWVCLFVLWVFLFSQNKSKKATTVKNNPQLSTPNPSMSCQKGQLNFTQRPNQRTFNENPLSVLSTRHIKSTAKQSPRNHHPSWRTPAGKCSLNASFTSSVSTSIQSNLIQQ